ncbi:GNAT family N-acetyltransferase [Levilactobacillus suantsaii]|uniref:GNAT family N-acetyltransferase n=1 Tax=Levilactobacillus suantsaii TaxID=2292255 RepID=UPI00384ED348
MSALRETAKESKKDFPHYWIVLKLVADNQIAGAIHYRERGDKLEIGQVMVHSDYCCRGFAKSR